LKGVVFMDMNIIKKSCEVIIKANQKWDELPAPAKPVITGLGVLIGLITYKVVLAGGIILFFGQRTINALGIPQQILKEEKEKEIEKADKSTA